MSLKCSRCICLPSSQLEQRCADGTVNCSRLTRMHIINCYVHVSFFIYRSEHECSRADSWMLMQLEEVQQDDWLPVKTKKHALHVGSPDSGTEWPVRSPAKATRKDTAGHEHRTARPSTLNNKPQQASSAAAAVQLPSRSTWPGNASSAESEQPVQQQQRKSGPDRRSRGGHRPSRPRRSWPMSRIDEVPEGSIQPDIPDAANARGIRAVHAVQGYMSHAGSSLSPRVGMLPDVTSNGPVPEPDRRAQGVIGNGRYRRPREAPQHRQQQGGTSAISLSHPAPSGDVFRFLPISWASKIATLLQRLQWPAALFWLKGLADDFVSL